MRACFAHCIPTLMHFMLGGWWNWTLTLLNPATNQPDMFDGWPTTGPTMSDTTLPLTLIVTARLSIGSERRAHLLAC